VWGRPDARARAARSAKAKRVRTPIDSPSSSAERWVIGSCFSLDRADLALDPGKRQIFEFLDLCHGVHGSVRVRMAHVALRQRTARPPGCFLRRATSLHASPALGPPSARRPRVPGSRRGVGDLVLAGFCPAVGDYHPLRIWEFEGRLGKDRQGTRPDATRSDYDAVLIAARVARRIGRPIPRDGARESAFVGSRPPSRARQCASKNDLTALRQNGGTSVA
jgi:hypothetical protein